MSVPFDAARFLELSAGLTLGRPLVATLETGSTNDDALAAARSGAPHGALFVTEAQRAGRGRRGNTWLATPGEGLLFSLVIRPKLALERAPALALLAGLAVRSAVAARLRAAGVKSAVLVKWPNDVVVRGEGGEGGERGERDRKLAGVLVESQVRGAELGAVVVGVGLNVGRVALPVDLEKVTTSLAALGVSAPREGLMADILRALESRLSTLENTGMPLKSVVGELRLHDALEGKHLGVGSLTGVGRGIDAVGNLKVVDGAGVAHRVGSGHVRLLA